MKKLTNILAAVIITASVFAQAPQKMSYQAVIRNSSNTLITSTVVGMQISILQGSATGTPVYVETQTPVTNANGLVSLEIGSGTIVTGTFSGIDWANGPYFIKTETDPAGGTTYTLTGTSQLLSVPYALFSANGGIPGPQGIQGLTGPEGPQGPIGLTGPAGADGTNGIDGAVGLQGPIGLTGPTGADGTNGIDGAVGLQGPIGLTGPAGADGTNGIDGAVGPQGPIGLTGATGSFPSGNATGDMQYWNGTQWVMIPVGTNEQALILCNGIPHWGPCPVDTSGSDTTVTDNEGNVYSTVTIGTQTWMKENLRVTQYSNGDTIPTTTSTSIPNDSTSKYQWAYNNDNNNVATYGRLYTWWAVTDSRNICPTGWHVPSDTEWHTLALSLDAGAQLVWGTESSTAGGKMKEAGTSHWISPNTGADNSSGFSALPGGGRGTDGSFGSLGYDAYFWSATETDASNAWGRYLDYYNADIYRDYSNKHYGFSVRCVRD